MLLSLFTFLTQLLEYFESHTWFWILISRILRKPWIPYRVSLHRIPPMGASTTSSSKRLTLRAGTQDSHTVRLPARRQKLTGVDDFLCFSSVLLNCQVPKKQEVCLRKVLDASGTHLQHETRYKVHVSNIKKLNSVIGFKPKTKKSNGLPEDRAPCLWVSPSSLQWSDKCVAAVTHRLYLFHVSSISWARCLEIHEQKAESQKCWHQVT